jgi:hypothetical protein
MQHPSAVTERRSHPRAPLKLPARIRWQGPFGMRLEVTETIDVSRDSVLVRRKEPCELGGRVWIVFPFSRGAGTVQPETPARIARIVPDESGGYWVALHLELPPRGTAQTAMHERRRSERVPFSLPIFVRPEEAPWPEESMTHDISQHGVRFETSHVYETGDVVCTQIPWGEWAKKGEIRGSVVRLDRVQEIPDESSGSNGHASTGTTNLVAVEWLRDEAADPLSTA